MLACRAPAHTSRNLSLPETPVLPAPNLLTAAARLLRWRVLLYLLLLAAAAALAMGERSRPNPAPASSAAPIVDPD